MPIQPQLPQLFAPVAVVWSYVPAAVPVMPLVESTVGCDPGTPPPVATLPVAPAPMVPGIGLPGVIGLPGGPWTGTWLPGVVTVPGCCPDVPPAGCCCAELAEPGVGDAGGVPVVT